MVVFVVFLFFLPRSAPEAIIHDSMLSIKLMTQESHVFILHRDINYLQFRSSKTHPSNRIIKVLPVTVKLYCSSAGIPGEAVMSGQSYRSVYNLITLTICNTFVVSS